MRLTLFHPSKGRSSAKTSDLLAMQARKEVRLAHYERFFGPSFAISAVVEGAPFVDLCVCPPHPVKGRDHYTLATDGLSDLPLFDPHGRPNLPPQELFTYTGTVEGEALAVALMRSLAQAMADPSRALKAWEPVNARVIDPAVPPEARAGLLLLLPPVREWPGFESRRYANGQEVRFLWAMLVTAAEARAARAGREEFLERLRSFRPAPLLDPARPSMV